MYIIHVRMLHVVCSSLLLPATTTSRWVVVLSPEESYGGLVSTSAELCQQAAQGRLAVDSIDPAFLSSRLEGKNCNGYSRSTVFTRLDTMVTTSFITQCCAVSI